MPDRTIVIGTRTSQLALWQSNTIKQLLESTQADIVCRLEPFVTKGDKTLDKPLPQIGGKGLFTAELEAALRDGRIDLAVHSLKDLPTEDASGLIVGAICFRADVRDVLVSNNGFTLDQLPPGAIVGTSSLRRKAQLLAHRSDLAIRPIRGNVDTRVRKVADGEYDAVVLAAAGVVRLGLSERVSDWLPVALMMPAPGQAALAVQCRAEDSFIRSMLAGVNEPAVHDCVTAERAFLSALGGGCSLPVGAYAEMDASGLSLQAVVAAEGGQQVIRLEGHGRSPRQLGQDLAQEALLRGARALLP